MIVRGVRELVIWKGLLIMINLVHGYVLSQCLEEDLLIFLVGMNKRGGLVQNNKDGRRWWPEKSLR